MILDRFFYSTGHCFREGCGCNCISNLIWELKAHISKSS